MGGMILWCSFESNVSIVLPVMWFVDFDSNMIILIRRRRTKLLFPLEGPSAESMRGHQQASVGSQSLKQGRNGFSSKAVSTKLWRFRLRRQDIDSLMLQLLFFQWRGSGPGFSSGGWYMKGLHYEAPVSLETWGVRATAAKKWIQSHETGQSWFRCKDLIQFFWNSVCVTWKDIEFDCSLLPFRMHVDGSRGALNSTITFFASLNQIVSKSRNQPRPFWKFKKRKLFASPQNIRFSCHWNDNPFPST